jgi:hypothetical protein
MTRVLWVPGEGIICPARLWGWSSKRKRAADVEADPTPQAHSYAQDRRRGSSLTGQPSRSPLPRARAPTSPRCCD